MPHKPPTLDAIRRRTKRPCIERQSSKQRGYSASAAWNKESKAHRRANPLCVRCKARGKIKLVDLTDHILPTRYFPELFFEPSNWQSLCIGCHALKTREDEHKYGHLRPQGGGENVGR